MKYINRSNVVEPPVAIGPIPITKPSPNFHTWIIVTGKQIGRAHV